jgi:hypothetical protein
MAMSFFEEIPFSLSNILGGIEVLFLKGQSHKKVCEIMT